MMRCQDCGNQAKKDCFYYRCRTCCKSRGFECQTHIKSTWVPVSTRDRVRPHPQPHDLLLTGHHHQQHLLSSVSTTTIPHQQHLSNPCKRFRHHSSAPSGLREGNLPAEVSFPATFRCLRVSSSDDNAVDQYAYQTSVNIGGHVFKGILYDQGPAADHNNLYNMGLIMRGEGETSTGGLELQPNLNITTYSSFPFF